MFATLLASLAVGAIGGFTSGLMGVSPGGGLVVFSTLLLGAEQHIAQGLSLVAQIPPTSLAGIRRYGAGGTRAPSRWLLWLIPGFLAGGIGGALAAVGLSGAALRWIYVLYLAALASLAVARPPAKTTESSCESLSIRSIDLLIVGAAAGFSSGLLGIGGGLAINVGLGAWLKAPRRQAQVVSLALSIIPTTIPAAYVYWRHGWTASWLAVAGVLVGLWLGTDVGARVANWVSETALHRALIGFVSAMTIYMAWKALT